jgi:AcrR family transcriptional regulator
MPCPGRVIAAAASPGRRDLHFTDAAMTSERSSCSPRSTPPARAAAGWERTHGDLTAVATDLFRRYGVHSTSIDDIVTAANLTKPTLYRHFSSKEELVVACLREEGRQTRRALMEAVELTPREPSQRIRAIGDYFAAKFADTPSRGLFALNLAVEFSQPETPIHEAIQVEIARLHDQLAHLIAQDAPTSIHSAARKLALVVFGASAACQAVGATACEHLVESVEGIIAEFRT